MKDRNKCETVRAKSSEFDGQFFVYLSLRGSENGNVQRGSCCQVPGRSYPRFLHVRISQLKTARGRPPSWHKRSCAKVPEHPFPGIDRKYRNQITKWG